jgi:hypothetical protein
MYAQVGLSTPSPTVIYKQSTHTKSICNGCGFVRIKTYTVWVENFEAINFRCFCGVNLDPRILNLGLEVQLLSRGAFQVLPCHNNW